MPRRPTNRALAATVGARVRDLRHKRGLSQEALAELASLNRTYIGDIEHGRVNVTLDTLSSVVGALDSTLADLLAGI